MKDNTEFSSLPTKKRVAHQLTVYRRIRAECWKNESEEVKAEIQKLFDKEHEAKADQDDEDNEDEDATDEDKDKNDDEDDEKILLQRRQE